MEVLNRVARAALTIPKHPPLPVGVGETLVEPERLTESALCLDRMPRFVGRPAHVELVFRLVGVQFSSPFERLLRVRETRPAQQLRSTQAVLRLRRRRTLKENISKHLLGVRPAPCCHPRTTDAEHQVGVLGRVLEGFLVFGQCLFAPARCLEEKPTLERQTRVVRINVRDRVQVLDSEFEVAKSSVRNAQPKLSANMLRIKLEGLCKLVDSRLEAPLREMNEPAV